MVPAPRGTDSGLNNEGAVSVSEPLDFLRATTYKQREVCQVLSNIAEGEVVANEVIDACQFLTVELILHLSDEAEDMVPMLRERCKPHDNIEPILEDVSKEHGLIRSLGLKLSRGLMAQVASNPNRKPSKPLRTQAADLLKELRRLSAIENGILLPMARVRLTSSDLEALSLSMAKRRGWAT